jgi:GAF domain-containing protein
VREEQLARAFVEFSDTLGRDYDVVEFLSRLCLRSVEVLEVTAAGALLTDRAGQLRMVAASTETVTFLETLQIQRQEGPCVDAYRSGRRVAVPDLRRTARRWPVFTPRALEAGMAGVCAFPMRLRTDRIGALNVFQATPGAFDQAAVFGGQALADVATIAILQARAVEGAARLAGQLEHALESRVAVEQAKGILAERLGSTRRWRSPGCGAMDASTACPWPSWPAKSWTGPSPSTTRPVTRVSSRHRRQPGSCREIPEECRTPQTRRP